MSIAARIVIGFGDGHVRPFKTLADLRLRLLAEFSRLLRELPEVYQDVDPGVFTRVPVPV